MHTRQRQRAKVKKRMQVERPKNIIILGEEKIMSDENKAGVEDLTENISNVLAGVVAQNGFRKTFTEATVRKHVTDTAVADALVAELNEGYDKADAKFDEAAKAEAGEVDLPESDDAGDLVKNLFE